MIAGYQLSVVSSQLSVGAVCVHAHASRTPSAGIGYHAHAFIVGWVELARPNKMPFREGINPSPYGSLI